MKFLLSLILLIAGLVHLVKPEVFLPAFPKVIPFKIELIYVTGVFEIILAIGLLIKKFQDLAAKTTALYFLLLLPVHMYVSLYSVEIFGINNPILLWARTLFQFVFFFWALSLQNKGWIIEQKWKHVLFLHYKIDPEIIQPLVPFKLDLYEGQAVISIVPFLMEGIRFPFLPAIPWISKLWELNIRTYVEVNGIKGIYFFTLETDSKIGELIAQKFFHLPYRYSKISAYIEKNNYKFNHQREEYSFNLEAEILESKSNHEFDDWATERYSLFTKKENQTFQGIVAHEPWELRNISINQLENNFTSMVTNEEMKLCGSSYADYLKVRFRPFIKIKTL